MFAVCVTFDIHPERFEAFLPLMKQQAKNSLDLEDGCHQFDVLSDPGRPHSVFLYELYRDPEAFQLHLKSQHFELFDKSVGPMVATKQVVTYSVVE